MKYWKLKDGSAVERSEGDASNYANEITKEEYDSFISAMPKPLPIKTDIQRLIAYAKLQGWI